MYLLITSADQATNEVIRADVLGTFTFSLDSRWCLRVLTCAAHVLTALSTLPFDFESQIGNAIMMVSACLLTATARFKVLIDSS